LKDSVIAVCKGAFHNRKQWPKRRTRGMRPFGVTRVFVRLLTSTSRASMSLRLSRNGVLDGRTWNSICPIGVLTLVDPIEEVDPIPNCILTVPCADLSSVTLSSRRWSAWNCSNPAVECFDAPVSITIPKNSVELYLDGLAAVKMSTILSISLLGALDTGVAVVSWCAQVRFARSVVIEVANGSDSGPHEVKKTVEVGGVFAVCSDVVLPSLLSSPRRASRRSPPTSFKKSDSLSSKLATYCW